MVVGKVPGHGSTVELGGFKVYLLLPTDPEDEKLEIYRQKKMESVGIC